MAKLAVLVFAAGKILPRVTAERVVTSFDFDVSRHSPTQHPPWQGLGLTHLDCGARLHCHSCNRNAQWKFLRGESPGYNSTGNTCPISDFPINMTGMRCNGMRAGPGAVASADACRAACCSAAEGCEIYQFNPDNGNAAPCWFGLLPHDVHDPETGCVESPGWISQARDTPLPSFAPPKPGKQSCPESPTCIDYADTDWRSISVPHDFVVEGTFSPNATENHGFL
jgi:hypothetical protein